MAEPFIEALETLRDMLSARRALWLRAAAGATGPVVADAADDQGPLPLEGEALGSAVGRPRSRWVAHLTGAHEVLANASSAVLAQVDSAARARVIAGERRVFGVLIVEGLRRRAVSPRGLVALERADRTVRGVIEEVEARPPGHLVVDCQGRVLFGSPEAAGWRAELLDEPLEVGLRRGVCVSAADLDGAGGAARLLHLSAPQPLARAVDADLSTSQRRVAQYAAVGATVPEIARSLRNSQQTVRTHLREVYRRLGVCSRVELVRALGGYSAELGA